MLTLLTLIQNPKEEKVFKSAFEQAGIKMISGRINHASYLKAIQYNPHLILMELPQDHISAIKFMKLLRKDKRIREIPLILYGPVLAENAVQRIISTGVSSYLARPLNFKKLIEEMRSLISLAEFQKEQSKIDVNQLTEKEIYRLLDPEVMPMEKLDLMESHIKGLLAFPATVANVLRVSQDDKSGAAELAKVIKADPSASAEVLRVSNSVYFASRYKSIVNVKNAIVRLGFLQTKNIAMSLSVFKVLKEGNYSTGFNHVEFWFHSLGTAIISEHIARSSRLVAPEEAFICGLLHDLGVLLFNEYFNHIFQEMLEGATNKGLRFTDYQKEHMGMTHKDLVSRLFDKWNFPRLLSESITEIYEVPFDEPELWKSKALPIIVSLADILSKSLLIGREADCCVEPIPNDLMRTLRFGSGIPKQFIERVYHDMNVYNSFLKIDNREFPVKADYIENAENVSLLCHSFTQDTYNPIFQYLQTQGYQVTQTSDLERAAELAKSHHAFIFSDAQDSVLGDIEKLADQKNKKFHTKRQKDEEETGEMVDSKLIVFDPESSVGPEINDRDFSVLARYPVDLRNMDMLLAQLLQDVSISEPTSEEGTLVPLKGKSLDGKSDEGPMTLIVHQDPELEVKLREALGYLNIKKVYATDNPDRALRSLPKSDKELRICILDYDMKHFSCIDFIEEVKKMPGHKRAEFALAATSAAHEELPAVLKMEVKQVIQKKSGVDRLVTLLENMVPK